MSSDPSPSTASSGDGASALDLTLRALRPLLASPDVMELCINRPREAFLETRDGWRREVLPFADFEWCSRLAKLIANSTQQRIDASAPLLSASLPSGERVQIVMPPATTADCVAIAIRRPAEQVWSIEELGRRGIFRATQQAGRKLDDTEEELLRMLASSRVRGFHAPRGAKPQEHPGVGSDGIGQDDVDQGADSGDSERRTADDHRGCTGTGARSPSESRAPVLLQGRSRRRPRHAEATAGIVPADETGPDTCLRSCEPRRPSTICAT